LHPPHLDADGVVVVQMVEGKTAVFHERKPVWVRGRISISRLHTASINSTFRLDASAVWGIDGH
jgi:hypothetical protein